jgi:hypothetical protein
MSDEPNKPITIVTGLARSGTTMMMHILRVAGIRWSLQADEVSGEDGRVMCGDWSWLDEEMPGRAMKLVDPLCFTPPPPRPDYRCIIMCRNYREQARSQRKLLLGIGLGRELKNATVAAIVASCKRNNAQLIKFIEDFGRSIMINFEDAILEPLRTCRRVADFIGCGDPRVMAKVIVNRSPRCLDYMLELEMTTKT